MDHVPDTPPPKNNSSRYSVSFFKNLSPWKQSAFSPHMAGSNDDARLIILIKEPLGKTVSQPVSFTSSVAVRPANTAVDSLSVSWMAEYINGVSRLKSVPTRESAGKASTSALIAAHNFGD